MTYWYSAFLPLFPTSFAPPDSSISSASGSSSFNYKKIMMSDDVILNKSAQWFSASLYNFEQTFACLANFMRAETYLPHFNRCLFSQKAPSQKFDSVLNTPLLRNKNFTSAIKVYLDYHCKINIVIINIIITRTLFSLSSSLFFEIAIHILTLFSHFFLFIPLRGH